MNTKNNNFYLNSFLFLILIFLYYLVSENYLVFYVGRYFDGCDMMWSPSSLYLQNINVFDIYFSELKDNYIHCSNYPSYSISNIFFMLPLGAFELDLAKKLWLAFNIVLIAHLYFIYKSFFSQNAFGYTLIYLIFLFSKPMIFTLAIGQYGILALWGITICIIYEKNKLVSFAGYFLSGLKYTFFPIIFFYSFYKKNFFLILLFIFINIFALSAFSFKFDSSIITNFFNPLIVGSQQGGGGGDLMSVLGNHPTFPFNYIIILATSFFYFIIFWTKTYNNTENRIIYISLITITIFRHHIYDAIFLMPMFIYLCKSKNKLKFFMIIIILYFWFVYHSNFLEEGSLIPVMYTKGFRIFNFILLNFLLIFIFLDNLKPNQSILKFKTDRLKRKFNNYDIKFKL